MQGGADVTYMCHCRVNRVRVMAIIVWFRYTLRQDYANDETINSDHSGHDNGDHILHHALGMTDASVNQAYT